MWTTGGGEAHPAAGAIPPATRFVLDDRIRLRIGELLFAAVLVGLFVARSGGLRAFYLTPPYTNLWLDAHIYFRATAAWLAGANPWLSSWQGVPFAAPPPALLLNLPLQLLGEDLAVASWVVANAAAVVYLFRRFHLPWYWILFHPIAEGFLGGSSDLLLAALAFGGVGWLAALAKPYSAPAILAAGRLRQLVLAGAIGVATVVVLPWSTFLASSGPLSIAFHDWTVAVSALGEPLLMVAAAIALLSLRSKESLTLFTPAMLAQQPHYLVFSLDTISRSIVLTVFAALPEARLMAVGVIVYAIVRRGVPRARALSSAGARRRLESWT